MTATHWQRWCFSSCLTKGGIWRDSRPNIEASVQRLGLRIPIWTLPPVLCLIWASLHLWCARFGAQITRCKKANKRWQLCPSQLNHQTFFTSQNIQKLTGFSVLECKYNVFLCIPLCTRWIRMDVCIGSPLIPIPCHTACSFVTEKGYLDLKKKNNYFSFNFFQTQVSLGSGTFFQT